MKKILLGLAAIILVFLIFSFTMSTIDALLSFSDQASSSNALGRVLGALFGALVCIGAIQRVIRWFRKV